MDSKFKNTLIFYNNFIRTSNFNILNKKENYKNNLQMKNTKSKKFTNTEIFWKNINNKFYNQTKYKPPVKKNKEISEKIKFETLVNEIDVLNNNFVLMKDLELNDENFERITFPQRYLQLRNKLRNLKKKESSQANVKNQVLKNHNNLLLKLSREFDEKKTILNNKRKIFKRTAKWNFFKKQKSLTTIQERLVKCEKTNQKIKDKITAFKKSQEEELKDLNAKKEERLVLLKRFAELQKNEVKMEKQNKIIEDKIEEYKKRKEKSEINSTTGLESQKKKLEIKVTELMQALNFLSSHLQKLRNLVFFAEKTDAETLKDVRKFHEQFRKMGENIENAHIKKILNEGREILEKSTDQKKRLSHLEKITVKVLKYLQIKMSRLGDEEDPSLQAKEDLAEEKKNLNKYLSRMKAENELSEKNFNALVVHNKNVIDKKNLELKKMEDSLIALKEVKENAIKARKQAENTLEKGNKETTKINVTCDECGGKNMFQIRLYPYKKNESICVYCSSCQKQCLRIRGCCEENKNTDHENKPNTSRVSKKRLKRKKSFIPKFLATAFIKTEK